MTDKYSDRFRPVIIESPYAGCVPLHEAYLQACILDCIARGETPYASHQMLTKALDDRVPEERELGITAGLAMRDALVRAGATSAYYVDLDWSSGMIRAAGGASLPIDHPLVRVIQDQEWARVLSEAVRHDVTGRLSEAMARLGWKARRDSAIKIRDSWMQQARGAKAGWTA